MPDLAAIVHDLRNPLSIISVCVEELARPEASAADRDVLIDTLRRNVERMRQMLDRLAGDQPRPAGQDDA